MKPRQHTRHALAMTLALFALTACGGGGGSQPPAPHPPAGASTPPATTAEASTSPAAATEAASDDALADKGLSSFYGRFLDQEYASVVRLELDLLGMPTNLGVERIKIVEGKDLVEDLTVVDGEIRFITPADRGKTGTIRLVIEGNTTRRPLEIALGSPRFLEIADTSEFNDDVLDRAPIPLKVHGLGPGNRIGHEELTFEIDRDIELHHDASDVTMVGADEDNPLYLQEYWQPLPSGRGFFLSHDVLKTLLARQGGSDIWAEVVFNGRGKDNSFSRKWSFVAHVPVASIEGQLIDSSTKQAVRELAGRKLAIRGQRSNGTRAVTVIDDEGRFRLDDLSAGTYIAEVLDTQLPGFIQTLFHVRQDDTRVQVSLPYSTRAYKALTRKNIEDGKDGSIPGKPAPKQTNSTPSKTVQERPITESTCPNGFRKHSVYAADMQRSVLVCLP